jgi:hypothetical protein
MRLASRLAGLLLQAARDSGRAAADGSILIPLRISQTEMRTVVTSTRAAVARIDISCAPAVLQQRHLGRPVARPATMHRPMATLAEIWGFWRCPASS